MRADCKQDLACAAMTVSVPPSAGQLAAAQLTAAQSAAGRPGWVQSRQKTSDTEAALPGWHLNPPGEIIGRGLAVAHWVASRVKKAHEWSRSLTSN